MRFVFALVLVVLALLLVAFLLLVRPAWAGATRCTTYEGNTLGRLQMLYDDGTRATSYWNKTLSRWETMVSPPPGQTCTGRLNPITQQVEVPALAKITFTSARSELDLVELRPALPATTPHSSRMGLLPGKSPRMQIRRVTMTRYGRLQSALR
jgi:hypothetical protein